MLKGNSIFVTSPLDLNDPFEMRPGWTDEHNQEFHADQQKRADLTAGIPVYAAMKENTLKPVGIMPKVSPQDIVPVDSQRGLADDHNA